jgi:hypothetical protein
VAGIFLVIVCCAGVIWLVGWLGSLALLITGRIHRSTPLSIVGGVSLIALTMVLAVAIFGFFRTPNPTEVFTKAFGVGPSVDVDKLQSEYSYFMDSGFIYLKFNASPMTVDRIVARGLNRSTLSCNSNVEPPGWWIQPAGTDIDRYYGEFHNRDFASECEELIYDRSSNTVYFFYIGID